jgi:hypothetical protein
MKSPWLTPFQPRANFTSPSFTARKKVHRVGEAASGCNREKYRDDPTKAAYENAPHLGARISRGRPAIAPTTTRGTKDVPERLGPDRRPPVLAGRIEHHRALDPRPPPRPATDLNNSARGFSHHSSRALPLPRELQRRTTWAATAGTSPTPMTISASWPVTEERDHECGREEHVGGDHE